MERKEKLNDHDEWREREEVVKKEKEVSTSYRVRCSSS